MVFFAALFAGGAMAVFDGAQESLGLICTS
jgi:hypothetical protein